MENKLSNQIKIELIEHFSTKEKRVEYYLDSKDLICQNMNITNNSLDERNLDFLVALKQNKIIIKIKKDATIYLKDSANVSYAIEKKASDIFIPSFTVTVPYYDEDKPGTKQDLHCILIEEEDKQIVINERIITPETSGIYIGEPCFSLIEMEKNGRNKCNLSCENCKYNFSIPDNDPYANIANVPGTKVLD